MKGREGAKSHSESALGPARSRALPVCIFTIDGYLEGYTQTFCSGMPDLHIGQTSAV